MSRRSSTAARLLIGPALGLGIAILASGARGAPPKITPLSVGSSSANAQPRKGVVVVGVGESSSDATWPVAAAVYANGAVRPRIVDREARVLAGAPPPEGAPDETKELSELRAKVTGDDAASRAMLKEIARRSGALAIVVVFPATKDATAYARVYDAVEDRLESTAHRAEKGDAPWSPLVAALQSRYAAGTTTTTTPKPVPKAPSDESRPFYSSPWFWGAVGAAIGGSILIYAATRDSGNGPTPVRVDWGSK